MNIFNHEKLKKLRKEAGYTQGSFAEGLGIARTTYAEYEQGKVLPPLDKLKNICSMLDVPEYELLASTGADIKPIAFKISEQAKQQLAQREKALKQMKDIKKAIANSSIKLKDKELLKSVLEYMIPEYELTKAERNLKFKIERNDD